MTRRVLLAGEGKNELGGWSVERAYRGASPAAGVLEALLRKVAPSGWVVGGAVLWKQLPMYRAHDRRPKDELNTRALAVFAAEYNCDVIVFSRDRDGSTEREAAVVSGRSSLDAAVANGVHVVGGVAIESIEAWVLTCAGVPKAAAMGRSRAFDKTRELGALDTSGLVHIIERADFVNLRDDAPSLTDWLERAAHFAASLS